MKITAFIASAILAYCAVAAPVQSSSPLEKNSRENQKHEIEDLPPISTFVTPGGFIEKQAHKRLQKHSKRSDPRAEKVVGLLKRLDILNSSQTSDEKMADVIIVELESYLRTYRANDWKYDAPQVEVAAVHKAEDHLHGLNLTRDATLRHGEKLRDFCYQIDGSYHRKEACARGIMEKEIMRNLTAGLGKRAVSDDTSGDVAASQDASPSLTGQTPSVETSVSQFTLAYCPGESDWKPAEQFSDVSDCARLTRVVKTSELEGRQDDPAWLDKFIFPEYENGLSNRNDRRWEFEGSMSMEFEDPKSHETTDVDLEANWLSDWKRGLAQGNEEFRTSSAKQDVTRELADQIRKLEDDMGTEITKPSNEPNNATEAAKDATQDAVERFAAGINKRGLPESVRKLENEIGFKITEPYNEATQALTEFKNSTERRLHRLAHKAENLIPNHPYSKEGSPANDTDDLEKLFAEHYKFPAFRDFLHRVFNITSGNGNSTSCSHTGSHDKSATNHSSSSSCGEGTCRRIHAKDFKQSGKHLSPRERTKYCTAHKYGTNTPEFEFSQHHSAEVFDRMVDIMDRKHKAWNRYDEDRFISKAEQRLRIQQLMLEYDEAGFDPSTPVAKPTKKTLY